MFDYTQHEILHALFYATGEKSTSADPRIEILAGMVFDLLLEVEALRAGLLGSGSTPAKESPYGRAYRDAAYLTHDASGPSSGPEKLLALFYSSEAEEEVRGDWRERRTWRECLMLQRLGLSRDEIRAYEAEAKLAETFT